MAAEQGWTLKEVAARSGLPYSTVTTYAQRESMTMTDYTAIRRLTSVFDVLVDDLVEILEE